MKNKIMFLTFFILTANILNAKKTPPLESEAEKVETILSLEKDSVEYTAEYKAIEKRLNKELEAWKKSVDAKCEAEMYDRWHRDPDLLKYQGYTGYKSGKKPYYDGRPCSQKKGFVHSYWEKKKEILKEKFGIEWKSPAERNHAIIYD